MYAPAPHEVYRAVNSEVTAGRVEDANGEWLATLMIVFHGAWNDDVDANAHVYAYMDRRTAQSLYDQLGLILPQYDAIEQAVAKMDDAAHPR